MPEPCRVQEITAPTPGVQVIEVVPGDAFSMIDSNLPYGWYKTEDEAYQALIEQYETLILNEFSIINNHMQSLEDLQKIRDKIKKNYENS